MLAAEQIFLLNTSCRKRVECLTGRCDEFGLKMKGWERGRGSSEKVKVPSWEGEWDADPTKLILPLHLRVQVAWGNAVYFWDCAHLSSLLLLFMPCVLLQRQKLLFSTWHRQARPDSRAAVRPLTAIDLLRAWCQPSLLGCMWDGGTQKSTLGKY